MEAIDRFGISTQQLVCCVSDNSANMVKLVKDLDKAARVISAGNGDTDNASEVDDIEDATEATDTDNALGAEEEAESIEDEDLETTEEDHEDMMHHGEVIDDVLSRLPVIDHMRCGVHTFQ